MAHAYPRDIRRVVAFLERETGIRPTVEVLPGPRWRVTMAGEHVHMTVEHTREHAQQNREAGKWASSTLSIDGEARPLAQTPEAFTALWRELEGAPEATSLPPVPPGGEEEPPEIAQVMSTLHEAFTQNPGGAAAAWAVSSGFDAQRQMWVIGATSVSGLPSGMRMFYRHTARGWVLAIEHLIVVSQGQNMTRYAKGDISRALHLMMGGAPESAPAPAGPAVRASSLQAPQSRGVQVRTTSVIRT